MTVLFRATKGFMEQVRADLLRPHAFAYERVGFISVRAARAQDRLVLLAERYYPVADEDYLPDPEIGAMMSSEAIRKALNIALLQQAGVVHIHLHDHRGPPRFSGIDLTEQNKFVPDFFSVAPEMPHGAVVLSHDRAAGRVWLGRETVAPITEFHFTGPTSVIQPGSGGGFNLIT